MRSGTLLRDGFPADETFFDETGHWKEAHYPQPFADPVSDPLQQKEFDDILQRCLQKLPALWTSVFRLKHLDDVSASVICDSLQITTSNYWVIIHRAKLSLRACLEKHWI